jgi:lambda family phage tail tape measure protein
MATTTATIAVNVTGQQSIDRLQASLGKTNEAFAGLKSALGALAIGSFVANAVRMAAALDDVAAASGMSLQAVVGFTDAVAKNGGTTEGAANAIGKFAQAIEGAAGGSKDLQDKFASVGVTLQDLRTLSEQDLLGKVVQGLAKGGNNANTMATAMALLGKNMRSVEFGAVANDIGAMTAAAGGTAESMNRAALAEEKFGLALVTVQRELLVALRPISEMVISLGDMTTGLGKFIKVAVEIATVIAGFTLLGKAFNLIRGGFIAMSGAVGTVSAGFASLKKTVEIFVWQLGKIAKTGEVTSATFAGLGKRFKFLQEGLVLLAKGFTILGAAAYAAWKLIVPDSIQQMLSNLFGATKDGFGEVADAEDAAGGAAWTAAMQRAEGARMVQDALDKEIKALDNLLTSYQAINAESNKKFQLETDSLKMSEAQRLSMQERFSAEGTFLKEMARLSQQYQEKSTSASESDLAMLPRITEAMTTLSQTYNEQIGVVDSLVAARVRAVEAQQLELFNIKQQQELTESLAEVQHRMATSTMSEIEKKYADIDFAAQKSARSAIAAEEARRNAALSPEEARAYYDAAMKGSEELKRTQQTEFENSRRFSTGWKRAFREYADNATNAARTAENLFRKATQGMEDAIVNFAKTGKFEWKGFVNMMLEELLRAQIQSIFAQMLGGMTGMMGGRNGGGGGSGGGGSSLIGSLLGGIGSLFGGGGARQQGPTRSGGNLDGGGGIFSMIGSGISSAIGGISDLFSGFFATGGSIPQGRFGIVGEAGPEFVGGPASVTPMSGTNVTYNINAVDAASFQTLLARDPSFIYALTEQGRRGYAGAR